MEQARHRAEKENPGWSEAAFEFLKEYAKLNAKFQVEDMRVASQGIENLKCKNQRSWGSITVKAAKQGIIHNHDEEYKRVKNVNAHATPSAVWKSNIYQYKKH
jgi:hypothetical protein